MPVSAILAGTPVHGNNPASLTPTNPTHQSGDLLLCVVFLRSTSATISTSTAGWSLGLVSATGGTSGVRFLVNDADSSVESDPVVTITGGAANVTVSAVVIRLRGATSTGMARGTVSSNSAAQDIAFGTDSPSIDDGNAVLAIGHKIDNNADPGMAVISGTTAGVTFAETVEGSSTLGSDHCWVVDAAINSSGSAYTAGTGGSVTVTGGTSVTSIAFYLEVAAAAVVTTIPVAHASAIYAGQTVAVEQGTEIAVAHASAPYAGQAVAITVAIPILSASVLYAGQSIAVEQGVGVSIVHASALYNGQTVNVLQGLLISLAHAVQNYIGQAVSITVSSLGRRREMGRSGFSLFLWSMK